MSNNVFDLLKNGFYPDLLIRYECTNGSGEIKVHRVMLATLPYFDALFRNTILRFDMNLLLFTTDINFPFNIETLFLIIDYIYQRKTLENISSNIADIINALYFIGGQSKLINKFLKKYIRSVYNESDSIQKYQMIIQLLDIFSLESEYKKTFLKRFFYCLNEDQRKFIQDNYLKHYPDIWYSGKSSKENNKIIIVGNIGKETKYIIDDLEFIIYSTLAEYDGGKHTGFWIECHPIKDDIVLDYIDRRIIDNLDNSNHFLATAMIKVYTGIYKMDIESQKISRSRSWYYDINGTIISSDRNNLKFPNWFKFPNGKDRVRYGTVIDYQHFDESVVFEFILSII